MLISLISFLTVNHVIGRNNCIPWNCRLDMEWFKFHTYSKPVIMGRKTFESIGKPLFGRLNIILSRNNELKNKYKDILVFKTPNEVLSFLYSSNIVIDEVMVIGGGEIYNVFMPYSNRLYLTYINIEVIGDVFFPFFNLSKWKLIFVKFYHDCCLTDHAVCFKIFERC